MSKKKEKNENSSITFEEIMEILEEELLETLAESDISYKPLNFHDPHESNED